MACDGASCGERGRTSLDPIREIVAVTRKVRFDLRSPCVPLLSPVPLPPTSPRWLHLKTLAPLSPHPPRPFTPLEASSSFRRIITSQHDSLSLTLGPCVLELTLRGVRTQGYEPFIEFLLPAFLPGIFRNPSGAQNRREIFGDPRTNLVGSGLRGVTLRDFSGNFVAVLWGPQPYSLTHTYKHTRSPKRFPCRPFLRESSGNLPKRTLSDTIHRITT